MIGAHQVLVQGLNPIMVTAILTDSSDPSWVTIAEQVNVTKSRSPGVPGYSVSPIPTSHIRASLLEPQQPIMQNESMMFGQLLLNIMILQYPQQRHQQQQRPPQRHPPQRHRRQQRPRHWHRQQERPLRRHQQQRHRQQSHLQQRQRQRHRLQKHPQRRHQQQKPQRQRHPPQRPPPQRHQRQRLNPSSYQV